MTDTRRRFRVTRHERITYSCEFTAEELIEMLTADFTDEELTDPATVTAAALTDLLYDAAGDAGHDRLLEILEPYGDVNESAMNVEEV